MKLCQHSRHQNLSQKNFQAQGGSAKSYEEKKMDKDNKIMMNYCKVSLGKKAM